MFSPHRFLLVPIISEASCSKRFLSVHSSSRGVHGKIATVVRFLDRNFCFSGFSFTRCCRSIAFIFMRRSIVPRTVVRANNPASLRSAQRNPGHAYPSHVEL